MFLLSPPKAVFFPSIFEETPSHRPIWRAIGSSSSIADIVERPETHLVKYMYTQELGSEGMMERKKNTLVFTSQLVLWERDGYRALLEAAWLFSGSSDSEPVRSPDILLAAV